MADGSSQMVGGARMRLVRIKRGQWGEEHLTATIYILLWVLVGLSTPQKDKFRAVHGERGRWNGSFQINQQNWRCALLSYSRFSLDVTAAMLLWRTIAKKSFRNLILLLCKTWATFCHSLVYQHGRLITRVKTKNCHESSQGWQKLSWGMGKRNTLQGRRVSYLQCLSSVQSFSPNWFRRHQSYNYASNSNRRVLFIVFFFQNLAKSQAKSMASPGSVMESTS